MDQDAAADCYLSTEEINSNPAARALIQAFIDTQAAQLGVDPASVVVSGIHLDENTSPGCSATQSIGVDVHPDFAATLGDADAFADCFLSPDEIASDDEAAAFAAALINAQAAAAGLDPGQITLNGIHTDGDSTPGCQDTGRRLQTAVTTNLLAKLTIAIVR